MTDVLGINILQGGAGGIVALVVWMILTGRLVPRATLRDAYRQRDTWQEAHGVSEEARHLEREQTRELLEFARTADHVLAALPTAGEVGHGPAGLDRATPPR